LALLSLAVGLVAGFGAVVFRDSIGGFHNLLFLGRFSFYSHSQQLVGNHSYTVTFPKGQLPPVKGFWSLTMYNPEHFFKPNALKRYALGTKNKSLQYNPDGGLTIFLGNKSPGKEK